MKKLVKPQVANLKNLDSVDALCENTCSGANIGCVCETLCCHSLCKDGFWADDDKDEILF
jgi:hypothetical protein